MFKSKNISINYIRVKELGIVSYWNHISDSDIEKALIENKDADLLSKWEDFEYNLE